ncbi:MAG: class I SAM-dependent methyltransferase [Phycisphaerales bacterium]|nr:class I SAM-dependent methyltransferase [Phycisphaerales bacterium]
MKLPHKHTLYELCAQNPARDAALLLAIYADGSSSKRAALTLGEDFCATAALSRAWCGLSREFRAVAVDHDPAVLALARPHPRVRLVRSDVMSVKARVDLIAVQNFSIGEIHRRVDLVAYLAHARSRLNRSGAFVCDIYGGSDAFATGRIRQQVTPPPGTLPKGFTLTYVWEQRTADPLTGRVVNAMHFRIAPPPARAGTKRPRPIAFDDAFVYDWRLWSPAELREALLEAGFARVEAYHRTPGAIDQDGQPHVVPIEDADELPDAFNIYLAARTTSRSD